MPDGIDDLRRRECVRGGYDGGIDDVSVQVHASELKLNLPWLTSRCVDVLEVTWACLGVLDVTSSYFSAIQVSRS